MARTIRQRVKRRVCYRLARMVYPVALALEDIYITKAEARADSGDSVIPSPGTVAGQFEVAVNAEHQVLPVFGFGPPR